jgi:hypothetical protein
MENNQALEILINVALLAQSKGILSLDDAVIVKQAVDCFKSIEKEEEEEIPNPKTK